MRDLYSVLGVGRDADQATIRKAYKKLAREFHPDLNKSPKASDRFKEINAAYEVIGDEQRRANYDEFGEDSLRTGFDAEQARQWKKMGGGRGGFPGGMGGFPGGGGGMGGMNFEDLFGNMFRGGGGGAPRNAARKGADIEGSVAVPLVEALRGASPTIHFRRPAACRTCKGEGGTGRSTCEPCKGAGRVKAGGQFGGFALPCEACGGSGWVYAQECDPCGGTGRTMIEEALKVKLPEGVEDGQTIRLRGKGGDGERGGPPGDCLLTVKVTPHELLRREGADLYLDLPLSLKEAVVGGQITVALPDGEIKLRVPPNTPSGRVMRVRSRGAAKDGQRGDLYLVMRPTPPVSEDPEVARLAEALDAFYAEDVRAGLRWS